VVGIRTRDDFLPFYVGQTRNLRRRLGEYYVASYFTSTDFRVGNAIKYFQEKTEVTVMFEPIDDPKKRRNKEKSLRTELQRKMDEKFGEKMKKKLLNDSGSYDPREKPLDKNKTKHLKEVIDFAQRFHRLIDAAGC